MDITLTRDLDASLCPILETHSCIAWIGSGLSAALGYPGWVNTLDKVCEACGVPRVSRGKLKTERVADLMMDRADKCRAHNPDAYANAVHSLFEIDMYGSRSAIDYLVQLPFVGYVTTNLDHSLERAVRRVYHREATSVAYPLLPVANIYRPGAFKPIFHIHGAASDDRSQPFIMARSEYDDAYRNGVAITSFLEQLLPHFHVVFIGSSLDEPDLEAVFDRVRPLVTRLSGRAPVSRLGPRRLALVPMKMATEKKHLGRTVARPLPHRDWDAEASEDRRFAELGVSTIRYRADTRHTAIDEALEYIYRRFGGETDYSIKVAYDW